MKLNTKQRAAIFEKLKSSGKLKKDPMSISKVPGVEASVDTNKVDLDYIGKPRQQRFKKLKNIFGM